MVRHTQTYNTPPTHSHLHTHTHSHIHMDTCMAHTPPTTHTPPQHMHKHNPPAPHTHRHTHTQTQQQQLQLSIEIESGRHLFNQGSHTNNFGQGTLLFTNKGQVNRVLLLQLMQCFGSLLELCIHRQGLMTVC